MVYTPFLKVNYSAPSSYQGFIQKFFIGGEKAFCVRGNSVEICLPLISNSLVKHRNSYTISIITLCFIVKAMS